LAGERSYIPSIGSGKSQPRPKQASNGINAHFIDVPETTAEE
jgi:hypothetical protein